MLRDTSYARQHRTRLRTLYVSTIAAVRNGADGQPTRRAALCGSLCCAMKCCDCCAGSTDGLRTYPLSVQPATAPITADAGWVGTAQARERRSRATGQATGERRAAQQQRITAHTARTRSHEYTYKYIRNRSAEQRRAAPLPWQLSLNSPRRVSRWCTLTLTAESRLPSVSSPASRPSVLWSSLFHCSAASAAVTVAVRYSSTRCQGRTRSAASYALS